MKDFSQRMDDALYEYFAGVLRGRCGLRSSMGGQLEAMAAAAMHPRPRDGEFMPVQPESRHANRDFAVTEDMLAAARAIGLIEKTLALVDVTHLRVLRAHYADPIKAPFRKLAVVLGSEDDALELMKRSRSEDRSVKREGRKELASAEYRVRVALEAAQAAYELAVEVAAEQARTDRHARFEAGLS